MGSHVWQFLAGIALFLYALDLLEGIAKSGGSAFQKRVQKATNTKLKSVLTGIGLVNIIQSSHAVSLILLALVGGGLISLVNAIGVIIGMNIGSVFMEAFVGLFGLWFDLDTYVLPIIAIWGLGAFFSKKYRNIFLIILSLGLVFFGLEMMKDGVAVMKESIDLSQYTHLGRGWYILIGFIGTNMIQSSSAMTIITMTALYEDIIPFPMAVALLMGAYIWINNDSLYRIFKWVCSQKTSSSKSCTIQYYYLCNILSMIWIGDELDSKYTMIW
jgi:phosphate:Na+ symporter